MRTLFIALSVLCLLAAIAGGVHYGPIAAEREVAFQQSVEELARHHEEMTRLEKDPEARTAFEDAKRRFEEEEAAMRTSAKLVASAKGALGGSIGGGIIFAAVFAFLAKPRRRAEDRADESGSAAP